MRYFIPCLLAGLFTAHSSQAQQDTPGFKPQKSIIKTDQAPLPIGPYSQAVSANGFLFVAGQVGIDPKTNKMVGGGLEAEAAQVMENILAILQASGLDFSHVVKTTIYLKDISQFAAVNALYGKFFPAAPPARETVEVSNLPGNANLEISVIAAKPQ